ncbi:MAG TPA: wax ester/triacylglycerol synthase family O-acyltransferase [Solirubrobacterales bacterium]|nr:wax ester/triacylglycerol synthase family O-acyltransferase [Solirubrobacterales bacterium]
MPAADAAWLHMDRPTNPMVINSLSLLGGASDPAATTELIERRLVERYPRFRQRVVDPLGRRPAFEDDPNFDVEAHLHRRALPAPGDRTALEELIGDLITAPLDPNRPLWHAYLIEGEETSAVLWRIHHCIADGISLSQVLFDLTDEGAGESTGPAAERAGQGGLVRRFGGIPAGALVTGRRLGGAVLHEGMRALADPEHLRQLASGAVRDAATTAKLVGAGHDAETTLRAPLTGRRRVAWTPPFELAAIRDASHRHRVTINDTLVAALAAALHATLDGEGDMPPDIHAMVPFNLRSLEGPAPAQLGNDFALILLELPIGEMPPAERLRQVNSRMRAIKRSNEAAIAYGMIGAIGLAPPWLEDRLIGFFTDKASLVVTNVPGPPRRLSFAGVPIEGVLVWAPCSGSLGMTVSIFSYAGEVTVGFMADSALTEAPGALAGAYAEELARLC